MSAVKKREKKPAKLKKSNWWKYPVAVLVVLLTALPLYVLISMSLKEPTDLASRLTWPDYVFFGNYIKILKSEGQSTLLNCLKNTVIVTVFVVVIEVIFGCMAAYPLARRKTRFNNGMLMVVLSVMMIPAVSVLGGVYSILVAINGINTRWALILITAAFGLPLSIYLYTNSISAIPRALDEAARIDGASYLQVFWHIILPQLKPVTVTVIIMKGVSAWNDYLYPSYIMQKPKMYTLILYVRQYFSEQTTDLHGAAACCLMAMLPLLILFIFLNKYFIKGAVDSAVK